MTDELAHNWNQVNALRSAMAEGEHGLSTVPELLAGVLREQSWREFVTKMGEHVEHERFADFVTEKPLAGLGSSVDLVRRIVADNTEALDLLDQALQNPVGVHHDSDNITISPDPNKRGTSRDGAIRKLRKDAPELHAEVVAGNLSAHAAMVQAGFRKRTLSVPAEDPERIAATLRRQLDPDTLAQLAKLLESP